MYQSISKHFKELKISELFSFKKLNSASASKNKKSSIGKEKSCWSNSSNFHEMTYCGNSSHSYEMTCCASSLDTQASTLDNKVETSKPWTSNCDSMSAEQFAKAVGLQVESFSDIDPEVSILSVIASKDGPSTSIISHSLSNTATTLSSIHSSFPKLDMNIFIPPPGYQSIRSIEEEPAQNLLPLTLSISKSSLQRLEKRRASDSSYFRPSQAQVLSDRISSDCDDTATDLNQEKEHARASDIIQIRKRGRFTMTVERSAQWTASTAQGKRKLSRFSIQSSNRIILSPDPMDPDLILNRYDTLKSNHSTLQASDLASTQPTKALKQKIDLLSIAERRDSGVESV